MEPMMTLGQYISKRRKHMRLTQIELADKVGFLNQQLPNGSLMEDYRTGITLKR